MNTFALQKAIANQNRYVNITTLFVLIYFKYTSLTVAKKLPAWSHLKVQRHDSKKNMFLLIIIVPGLVTAYLPILKIKTKKAYGNAGYFHTV